MKVLYICFVLLSVLLCPVNAQEANLQEVHETQAQNETVEARVTSSPDVSTVFHFPQFPDRRFVAGEIIEVLLGFTNTGDSTFNVTYIEGGIASPDFSYWIQNFTEEEYFIPVGPGERVTFSYLLRPDAMLEPRTYGLLATVFYVDETGANFTTYFYNDTVTLLEPVGSVDPQTFFTYSGILGLLGLAAVIAYKFQTSKAKKQTKQRIETGTRTQEIDEDWLQGTSADARTAASQKKKSSGKKST
eukprot:TRINITY_DN2097_c0_g1_i1.p1 TRINITY_DN2097_c0_g1~~TRINITY_DN2097_c0_g1_i1.p1  ORF type:complete len:245 (-),score=67.45 TRINITY_DN2097_c0_g1_i1:265-999(-)